jgi:hypothetical protein
MGAGGAVGFFGGNFASAKIAGAEDSDAVASAKNYGSKIALALLAGLGAAKVKQPAARKALVGASAGAVMAAVVPLIQEQIEASGLGEDVKSALVGQGPGVAARLKAAYMMQTRQPFQAVTGSQFSRALAGARYSHTMAGTLPSRSPVLKIGAGRTTRPGRGGVPF